MAQSPTEDQSAAVRSQNSLSVVSRRPSVDGTVSGQMEHYHSYRPVFSDGTSACISVPLCSPPVCCGPDLCSPHSGSWGGNHNVPDFYPEAPAVTTETSCFISRNCPSLNTHLEVSFAKANQCKSSKYSLQKFSSACPESPSQFPKPIYSYSILIFLALRNSKTGSLPVSEIYSFMTEHFPYFKTAPDGWKNSVRHNLSLNKCFEKVENKNGNSSRKGCLWALNPAKVDKMQEELHKWRRKDPGTVRRSMAKPEGLDHLLGEKPNKFKSLTTRTTMSTRPRMFSAASCYEQPRPPCSSSQPYPKSLYVSQSTPHPDPSYPVYSTYSQHVIAPRCLTSPVAGKMPPAYSMAPHEEHSRRSMNDLLMDGDAGCDIDTLNPSLTDLQLQGSLWEELKEDSARVVPSLSLSMLDVTEQSCYLQPTVSPTFEEMTSLNKAIYADEAPERLWGQDQNYLNGVYSGMESFAGCLSSCTTSVSLL